MVFKLEHIDPLVVFDRRLEQTHALRDMLAGTPSFLVGGGPSANELPMADLARRGVFSLGINNVAAHFPVSAFTFSDPPGKFHDGIWLDPKIMKFCPIPKLTREYRGDLRTRGPSGFETLQFDGVEWHTQDCPNVWGFGRRGWWQYDQTFFTDAEATWGNNKGGNLKTQNPRVLCTMLLGLRILYYLGSRDIFLIGVDFRMEHGKEYSFGESKHPGAAMSNNGQFAVVNTGLCKMAAAGIFEEFGLRVYNCNQRSGLRAFPYVPFDVAMSYVLKRFPKSFELSDWYSKEDSKNAAIL